MLQIDDRVFFRRTKIDVTSTIHFSASKVGVCVSPQLWLPIGLRSLLLLPQGFAHLASVFCVHCVHYCLLKL